MKTIPIVAFLLGAATVGLAGATAAIHAHASVTVAGTRPGRLHDVGAGWSVLSPAGQKVERDGS